MLNEKIFSIAHYIDQGVLYFLLFLSVLSVGMILERFFSLRSVHRQSQQIRKKIQRILQTQNPKDLEDLTKEVDSLESQALAIGLKHFQQYGISGLEELFNSFSLSERPDLERYLSFLATIGSNAPYVGLFGTVMGIMKAFNDLAVNTEAGQQTVMAGISVALVATAAGLFVAIPAVIFYNYFQRQVKSILLGVDLAKELCLSYAHQQKRS